MSKQTPQRPVAMPAPPWWLCAMLAIVSYFLLKYVVPEMARSAGFIGLADFLTYLAPLVTIAFLLIAASRLYAVEDAEDVTEEPGDEAGADSDQADRD